MAMTIQTNNAAITALKHLNSNQSQMNKSLERLSSGFRINSAADDAAGYAIASKLDGQNQRMMAAVQNASQATAMVKMADAAVNEIQNMVVRIQSLATQAASANNTAEISKLEGERAKLETQINKIANGTNYNGVNLLNGIQTNGTAGTAGTAVTTLTPTQAVSSPVTGSTVTPSGTATFGENATFTVKMAATGNITSITSSLALTNATTGAAVAAAATNLVTTAATAITIGGVTFTSAVGTTATTANRVAATATVAATGGTAYTPGTQVAFTAPLAFQVGADNSTNNQVTLNLQNSYTTTALGLSGATAAFTSQATAQTYIDTAKAALNTLITQRADLGSTQNQLTYVSANLATSIEQVSASVSSIRDADMATEMANFTKNQIMVQAGTAMLAQANQASQNVMSLFR